MKGLKFFGFAFLALIVLFCTARCKVISGFCVGQGVNPLQYGLNEAKTGEERYYVLQHTHEEAKRLGVGVSYDGVKTIDLTIPAKAKPIPLTHYTDFAGVTIRVDNNQKGLYLFTLSADLKPVNVSGEEIDSKDFRNNPTLYSGRKLLVITDKTPWVEKRKGHDYGAMRKDIMLVNNGRGSNEPIQSYYTNTTVPECYYCDVSGVPKIVFKNVKFERTSSSTQKTSLVKIENQYGVELANVTINTPEGTGLYGDRAIYIVNCADVEFSDITINGTYSLPGTYGYGISLDNVYDFRVDNLYARANWGMFGNNNVNKAYLKNCDFNRFDTHCYGRDVKFEKCNFVDLYNQFSAVYGKISFKDCTFTDFRPILIESSYNSYTAFDVSFEGCVFNFNEKHYCIIDYSGFDKELNSRPELREKCLPNVAMKNCQVNLTNGVKKWYVYNTQRTKAYDGIFAYVSEVEIKDVTTNRSNAQMEVYSHKIKTANKVNLKIENKN